LNVPGQDGYGNEGDRAESGDQLSDEDESDADEITHAVPFKCIGAAHEKHYQHHLEQACVALHGQDKPVNVRIQPEPLNPMDPSAIDVDYGTRWTLCDVDYIASEICKYIHPLIAAGDILGVYVQPIKYRVDFLK
jgi:hypothetical protein